MSFRAWLSVSELVPADDDRDQAGDLRYGPGEEGLDGCEPGVEWRSALRESHGRESNHHKSDCGGRQVDMAENRAIPAETLHIGSSVPDGGRK